MAEAPTFQAGVTVELIEGALQPPAPAPVEGAGALLSFLGVVRPLEDGRALSGLSYTTYDPMAGMQLTRIAEEAVAEHGLLSVHIQHSRGFVPVGGTSLRLALCAEHRKPAIVALDQVLDALKRDVPIWKNPVFEDATGA